MEWCEYDAYRRIENGGVFYYTIPCDGDRGIMICASKPQLGVKVEKFVECEKRWEPEWINSAGGKGCYAYEDYISTKNRIAARVAIRRRIEKWCEGDPLTIIL